jgi:hypothetical protein
MLESVSELTASCRDCDTPREVPVEGVCPACGSANVALSLSSGGLSGDSSRLRIACLVTFRRWFGGLWSSRFSRGAGVGT